jgi:hypothetical protein
MKLHFIATMLGVAISGSALAQDSIMATVTDVTAEGMPTYVAFKLSSTPSRCPGYTAFQSPDPEANKAVYVMLLEAVTSGGSVWVQYDSACRASRVNGVVVPPPEEDDRGRLLRRAARSVVKLMLWGL